MGLFATFFARRPRRLPKAPRRGGVERMEPRQLLAADVLLGSVYFEEATGDDSQGDVFQVSFVGGAAGTTLDRLVIDGDKRELITGFEPGDGRNADDPFFDVEPGPPGSFQPVGLEIRSSDGFTVTGVEVIDGGTAIVFTFEGFEAGEALVFSIDVDETSSVQGRVTGSNPLVEGAEFEYSVMIGEFSAPGHVDLRLAANYFDAFDATFQQNESASGAELSALPSDNYNSSRDLSDRTAGAVARDAQIELASLAGYVYHDRSDDGSRDAGEEAIAGVTVELIDASGQATGRTTTTDANGFYRFADLEAGLWGVREVQPTGWFDGKDTAGSAGGIAGNDLITGADLAWGEHATDYNFGELLAGSIAGRVIGSNGPGCDFDNPDILIAGVTIELLDPSGQVLQTTKTDSDGRYRFEGLRPGEYQIRELQPTGYYDGEEHAGTAGGVVTNDRISGIVIGSEEAATDYDFCEHVGADLSGYVYHDRSGDGVKDPGEEPIAGVELKLLRDDGTDTGKRAVTDSAGFYQFTNLDRGSYRVMEIHPAGWLDGLDTPGTHRGVADNPGDVIRAITLDFGDDARDYNFGEQLPGSIAGRVHASLGPDCDFDNPDLLLEGVTIELLDASGEVVRTTQTDAAGEYRFGNLTPGVYSVREIQPEGYFDGEERTGTVGGVISNDLISEIVVGSDIDATDYDFCEHVGGSLSGYVYHDRSDDGSRDAGEEAIGGVTVELLRDNTQPGETAKGSIEFPGGSVQAAGEVVFQRQVAPAQSGTGSFNFKLAASSGETIARSINIKTVAGHYYDFDAQIQTSNSLVISDFDTEDGILVGLAGSAATGYTINLPNDQPTNLNALAQFIQDNLAEAGEAVYEGAASDHFDPKRVGDVAPPTAISVTGSQAAVTATERIRVVSIDGATDHDQTILSFEIDGVADASATTHVLDTGDGYYSITINRDAASVSYHDIAAAIEKIPGLYAVYSGSQSLRPSVDIAPAQIVLTNVTSAASDVIEITAAAGGAQYNAEVVFKSANPTPGAIDVSAANGQITVSVHAGSRYAITSIAEAIDALADYNAEVTSRSGAGFYEASNPDLDTAPVITSLVGGTDLTPDLVPTGRTTTTDADGFYQFADLEAGVWGVREVQPNGWFDGKDTAGSAGGIAGNDLITGADLAWGEHATDYNFGELLAGSIAGRVIGSNGPDCDFDNPDILIAGVTIELLDPSGQVLQTTKTDSDGRYRFEGLRPGEYQIRELQPTGYYDGEEHAGTAGGVVTNDRISGIVIGSEEAATDYDFCEHVGADLSGYVYHDRTGDGVKDPGEEPIAGVELKLLREDGTDTGKRAVTDSAGFYQFTNLDRGSYRVMEIHPAGWLDGLDTPGTHGGVADNPGDMIRQITLDFGDDARDYNFGEQLPGSIAGKVHSSPSGDCDGPDAAPIAGVTIELLDASGSLIRTTVTDEAGAYRFDGLPPGQYAVREVQPSGYFDGDERVGTEGGTLGDDLLSQIVIGSAVDAVGYDFCELPPAELSGFVFVDGAPITTVNGALPDNLASIRDGLRTADDRPLRGVTVRLVNGVTGEPFYVLRTGQTIADVPNGFAPFEALPGTYKEPSDFETTTDSRGFYEFNHLPSGSYAVVEVGPTNFIDGIDTAGSTGGTPVNPIDPSEPGMIPITPFRERYGEDVIFGIPLAAGQSSVENNFSEVATRPLFIPPRPPEAPPEPPTLPLDVAQAPRPPIWARPARPGEETTFVGGGGMIPYTWHLSVVNAGRPRATAAPEGAARLASQSRDTDWDGADRATEELQRAKWRLLASDVEGADLSELLFGSEDAVPVAGDWDGDGVTDVGVYLNGDWYLDLDGDGRWGAGDLWAHLGGEQDQPVTGDWDGDGKTDIGVFGPEWRLDPRAVDHEPGMPDVANWPGPLEGKAKNLPPKPEEATSGERLLALRRLAARRADLIDHVFFFGVEGDKPVTGDFNGDGVRTIGVFRDGQWTLDSDGDGRLTEADRRLTLGRPGDKPLVGDFDGDGVDDLGVYREGEWLVDPDGDGVLTALRTAATDNALASNGADEPVVGDWDGDGADEPGLYSPGEATTADASVADRGGSTTK